LPAGPTLFEHAFDFVEVGSQTAKFLGHVDARGKHRHFLQDAIVAGVTQGLGQTLAQLFGKQGLRFGNAGCDTTHDVAHAVEPFDDHGRQLGAFATAAGGKVVERLAGQRHDLRPERRKIDALVTEHAGPAQGFVHTQGGRIGQLGTHLGAQCLQHGEQIAVELKLLGSGRRRIEGQSAFDLAARQACGKQLTQRHFQRAQILVNPEMKIQIAGIDAFQFYLQRTAL